MSVIAINSYNEFNQIINSGKSVVIDFWQTNCTSCRAMSPILERVSKLEQFNNVEFYKVDVGEQEQISREVGIRVMPTFIAYKDGKKIKEIVGANPAGLEELLQAAASQA